MSENQTKEKAEHLGAPIGARFLSLGLQGVANNV